VSRAHVVWLLLAACAPRPPDPPCPGFAPTGLTLDAAREAHRRAALRQELRYREAEEPGYTLRATAATADQGRIDRGEACAVDLFETGRLLFEHAFTPAEGLDGPPRRVQLDRRGGPETTSCASCHWRGGVAGAGGLPDDTFLLGDGDRVSSGDARNPPALQGAGAVEALAAEMSADLAGLRAAALARHAAGDVELTTKGVGFGTLHVTADGRVDTRDVHGVDPDLVIRPFGWKGTAATINEFTAESAALHFGITSADVLATNPIARAPLTLPPSAAPELTAGQLTALAVYVAALELPIVRPLDGDGGPFEPDRWQRGRALFETVGCADCHRPKLVLNRPIVTIRSPVTGGAFALALDRDAEAPRLARAGDGYPVELFSDLKRHDLGPGGASRHVQGGVAPRLYLTRRLWGLGDAGPYFHDGAAATIDAAIARHDGEAALARDNWDTLADADRGALRIFLTSLRRAPRLQIP
jgi:mono/diheme cytochrome c family protein